MESSTNEVNPNAVQNDKPVAEETSDIAKPSNSANYARQLLFIF